MNEDGIPEAKDINMFRFVIELIKFRPKQFAINFLGTLVFFFTPLAIGLVIREIFNNLLGNPYTDFSMRSLIWFIPLLYLMRVIMDISAVIAEFGFVLAGQILMRRNIMAGVFKQPGAMALPGSPGESISRFRGDPREVIWFANFIAVISGFALFSITAFIVMFSINSTVTLVILVPFVLVVYVVTQSRYKVMELRKKRRKAAGRVTGTVAEVFNSIQAIKVNTSEDSISRYFKEMNEERRLTSIKDSVFSSILRSFGGLIVAFSTGIILLLIAQEMREGKFTVGDFILFTTLLNWLQGFIRDIGEFIAWNQRSKVSYQRMYRLMRGSIEDTPLGNVVTHNPIYIKNPFPEIQPIRRIKDPLEILKIENLVFYHPESTNGISNINFSIKRGSFNIITGRIGSGKTTLLRTILGLLNSNKGKIYWNDIEIEKPGEFFIPPNSSYTSQVPRLFSDNVKDNLLMGLPEDSVELEKSVALAVVDEDIENFDEKYETLIGPRGMKLSGGQKQRLATARMFVRNSDLIVVDDLSSALDVETEQKLWDGIFKNTESTFLIVSHRKSVLQRADHIIVLKDGKIDSQGKLNDLLKSSKEMQNLWSGDLGEEEEEIEINSKIIGRNK